MSRSTTIWRFLICLIFLFPLLSFSLLATEKHAPSELTKGRLAYLVSDLGIPFWEIMKKGIVSKAEALGYQVEVHSADNNAEQELRNLAQVIRSKVDGIILSPTNSSAAVIILRMAKRAGIPIVIADIGADSGEYVSYISSDNFDGAYQIGKVLAKALKKKGWHKGTVGIVAIPQKRANGKARTDGFMHAMNEAGIKGAGLLQQVDFSYEETYRLSRKLIEEGPSLRAIWLQGSNQYQGALDAIEQSGKKGAVLLVTFDAEPEFLELIPKGILLGAAMQQPFLMGEEAVVAMVSHLKGERVPQKSELSILAVSQENIKAQLPLIRRNVLGQE